MTVIVGLVDGRDVWMGADSYSGNGYALETAHPKIITCRLPDGTPILFGVAGEHRAALLLQRMRLPKRNPEDDAMLYVGVDLVDGMRKVFEAAGFATKQDGQDQASESNMLIAFNGRLFSLWPDYTVVETKHPYQAMGAGMEVALGALAVTEGIGPELRLKMVLEAAAKHSTYVRGPFHIESIYTAVPVFVSSESADPPSAGASSTDKPVTRPYPSGTTN